MWGWIYVLGVGARIVSEKTVPGKRVPVCVCVRMMATRWEWENGSLGELIEAAMRGAWR
jgi:hypothetical protein